MFQNFGNYWLNTNRIDFFQRDQITGNETRFVMGDRDITLPVTIDEVLNILYPSFDGLKDLLFKEENKEGATEIGV